LLTRIHRRLLGIQISKEVSQKNFIRKAQQRAKLIKETGLLAVSIEALFEV
jgi:hypothetical protein